MMRNYNRVRRRTIDVCTNKKKQNEQKEELQKN